MLSVEHDAGETSKRKLEHESQFKRGFQDLQSLSAVIDIHEEKVHQVTYIDKGEEKKAAIIFFLVDIYKFLEILGEDEANYLIGKFIYQISAIAHSQINLSTLHNQLSLKKKRIQARRHTEEELWKKITREEHPQLMWLAVDIAGSNANAVASIFLDPEVVTFTGDRGIPVSGPEFKHFFVKENLQRLKIGRKLLKRAKRDTLRMFPHNIVALSPNNESAEKFFMRSGFEDYGETTVLVGAEDIDPVDFVFSVMCCSLEQLLFEFGEENE